MKQIQLTITAKSPLSIGRKKPSSVSEAADFIPGSVIRGAVASHLLRLSSEEPEPNDDFFRLFTDDNAAIFSNGYPTQNTTEAKVLPATAVSAKAKPGFLSLKNGNYEKYGVFDTLIDRFCAESLNRFYDPNCPKALEDGSDGRVEPFGGFYTCQGKKYQSQSVSKRLLTRVGINRRRATSEEQILYSLEVLNEVQGESKQPTSYRSAILIEDDELAQRLTTFIEEESDRIRLGGSASRGLGRVTITAKCGNVNSNVQSKIKQFNQALSQRWQQWNDLFGTRSQLDREYVTLDLQSDAILTENWKRTTVVTPEMLFQLANCKDDSLQLHAAYTSYDYVSGWNSAWGLMKDIDLITNKGSVYLLSTQQMNQWYEVLERLEQKGIGDRTCEGFGQVEICNNFHTIFREKAV